MEKNDQQLIDQLVDRDPDLKKHVDEHREF